MCGKVGELLKCSQCEVMSYCGDECYHKHYANGHKEFCMRLKGMVEEPKNRGKTVEKK
jgi:sulfatase maturation enzyme AslB (radical SAM superfamily)